ncbi:MAG: site-specific DNA-methyltransferase [Proteobacteria bacterium]|nr:site-specific DNA-methyltransferase [Pseudomonadota bacterium]
MAPQNRTLAMLPREAEALAQQLLVLKRSAKLGDVKDRVLLQDMEKAVTLLPAACVDLLVLDPPYNLSKQFGESRFLRKSMAAYEAQLDGWVRPLLPLLKQNASVYICGDWQSSPAIYAVAEKYFTVRGRITWEREKGRGAKANWKNCSEDIWFCTMGTDYYFDVDAVKLRRRVLAPYREAGAPKDWQESEGGNTRLTYPSNVWTDITVPFWSMPENTPHPTQKPEKLIAKLVLASCPTGGLVLDPFLGSGTSAVVAKKLGRHFIGIEREKAYACMALKRLALAEGQPGIQGYEGGVFWERNSRPAATKKTSKPRKGKA